MISLAALGSAASASSYYSADNYYTEDEARCASAWFGDGAAELGLAGEVDEQAFADVLGSKLPDGSRIEARNGEHRPGLDLTFSASKSVSLVAMLGGDRRLIDAVRESAKVTLAWAERNLIEARVWDPALGQQVPERTGNMLAATFLHDINRNGEPQLHVHGVIANATLASDGKWHALHNDALYKGQHVLSAVHNADLRMRVEKLGYETVAARNPIDGAFEIKGVGRHVIEAYSTRAAEIETATGDRADSSPEQRQIAALATRRGKEMGRDPAQRMAEWRETARKVGFDPSRLVEAALTRSEREQTVWSRLMQGVRGIGAKGMALVAHMGLTPQTRDPLVPERVGRLDPERFAAAHAVASAARELGEREAAFGRHDLIRTTLERQGPFTVETIETRIDQLIRGGQLIGGEKLLTTEQALALENRVIAAAQVGRGVVQPIAEGPLVAARLQDAAREMGLRRLNPGQEKAGNDILTSTDRIHLIQGGAGVGKSAALAPVAGIARAEGRNVYALSHVGRIAREFGEKTRAPASTVDGFLAKYARVIDGTASPERVAAARADLRGAVVMVDEASQIGTERTHRLIQLANQMEVGRLVLGGDERQLPAIDWGKPFADLQKEDLAFSHITQNLRARSPQMQAINKALERGEIGDAFEALKPATTAVPLGQVAETAARMWAERPKERRDQTILLASGRAMRSAGNAEAQRALAERGEIGAERMLVNVLDRVTVTREGARQIKGYREDRIVEFATDLRSQGFKRGERGRVHDVVDGVVQIHMDDGKLRSFDPSRLPYNLKADAVAIFQEKMIGLHEGDRIRWTAKDATRGLLNGDIAHVTRIDNGAITVQARDGKLHELARTDPMLERLDLAYAINVHVAQGMTATDGIIMMSAQEKALNTAEGFLVAVTRIAENARLVVDDPNKVERQIEQNPGGKTSARDAEPTRSDKYLYRQEPELGLDHDFEL